jgi:hypothetical protein
MIKEIHYTPSPTFRPRVERQRHLCPPMSPSVLEVLETGGRLPPPPAEPSLVSSMSDRFNRLLFTLPEDAFTHHAYRKVFKDLFKKLPDRVRYVFVAKESNQDLLRKWIKELRLNLEAIVTAPKHLQFTVWAEDAYAAVQIDGQGRSYLVEPKRFRRESDNYIANIVTAQCDIGLSYARNLIFQGGNLLAGDRFWLIGQDYLNQSGHYVADPEREFRFALEYRRKLVAIGSQLKIPLWRFERFKRDGRYWTEERFRGNLRGTRQPIFHIDMFLTLAGRDDRGRPIVLVGDPRLAAQTLDENLNEDALANVFDDIAEQLRRNRRHRFVVIRNPLPLVCAKNSDERTLLWYFATSNNALVQVEGNRKEVWLPTYGYGGFKKLKRTDDFNARIWRALGFTVHLLDDFHPFAVQLGAAHCIKKYLSRSD